MAIAIAPLASLLSIIRKMDNCCQTGLISYPIIPTWPVTRLWTTIRFGGKTVLMCAKENLGLDIGYTQSHRQEIDTGTVAEYDITVHDIPYSFKYQNEWAQWIETYHRY